MKYVFLIYEPEAHEPAPGSPKFVEWMKGYRAFSQETRDKGILLSGAPLEHTHAATTVRIRDGSVDTFDGPFAETKEQLGGFYMLECADLDEALQYAAKIPAAHYGCVEVRPVRVFEPPK